jgi:hypothetical protein
MHDLTDDQRLLRESAERFATGSYSFEHRRGIVALEHGFHEPTWRRYAEYGWLGLRIPEEHGGLGLPARDLLVLLETLGAAMPVEPLIPAAVLVPELLVRIAPRASRATRLARLAAGDWRASAALDETDARFNLERIATRAVRDGDGWRLSGRKAVVLGAPVAHEHLVLARTSGAPGDASGLALFAVPRGARGLGERVSRTVDGGACAELELDGVTVGPEEAWTSPATLDAVQAAVDLAAAAACADAVGALRAAVRVTAVYLRQRQQFGQPIGAFQALQHRMADMYIAERRAVSILSMLAVAIDAPEGPARRRAVSAAKAQVGRCGRYIAQQAIQLHGGIGVTDEYVVGHCLRRMIAFESSWGHTEDHLARFIALDA